MKRKYNLSGIETSQSTEADIKQESEIKTEFPLPEIPKATVINLPADVNQKSKNHLLNFRKTKMDSRRR